jgi:hypothetical protein
MQKADNTSRTSASKCTTQDIRHRHDGRRSAPLGKFTQKPCGNRFTLPLVTRDNGTNEQTRARFTPRRRETWGCCGSCRVFLGHKRYSFFGGEYRKCVCNAYGTYIFSDKQGLCFQQGADTISRECECICAVLSLGRR